MEKETPKDTVKKVQVKKGKKEVKAKFKKLNTSLVLDQNQVPYLAMDKMDDEVILAEISGKIDKFADKLVYCFEDKDGRQVTGLSWVGVKTMAFHLRRSRMANLSTEDVSYERDPVDSEYVIFKAKVRDLISGASAVGLKRQWLKTATKRGTYPNNFWMEQGRTKAVRNAMTELFPADWVAQKITEWIKQGKYAKIGANSQTSAINTGDRIDAKKIQSAVNAVNDAETKERLGDIDAKVSQQQSWSGSEKYFVRQLIQKKLKTL